MQYTIKDVLANPLLEGAELVTATQVISSKPVNSVAVIEMPVEDFVRKNELVLTTAIGCGDNPHLFFSYVKDIIASDASAMGVAIGRHVQSIPEEILEYCNEHSFPLIKLPWEVRFADITKTVFEQINRWEQNSLMKIDQMQRELLKLYLENRSLEEALQYLSLDFKMDIFLKYHEEEETIPHEFSFEHTFEGKTYLQSEPSIVHTHDGSFLQVVPIHLSNHETCYLLLKAQTSSSAPIPWLVLNQAVTLLTLWIQKEQTKLYKKNKEKKDFLKLLIKGDWPSKSELLKQGEKFGFNLSLPFVCIVGYPEKREEFYHLMSQHTLEESNKEFRRTISEIIDLSAKTLRKQIIYLFQRDVIVIFLECKMEEANQQAHAFLDYIDTFVEKNKIPLFSWGIGENQAGKFTFHKSYKNARTALEYGRNYKGPGQRSSYANTGIYQLLASLTKNPTAKELMNSTIGAIAAYDKEKGIDFLHTLASYIYHQGNVSQTSRALSLHRQSLLYRLRKIESLTNRSLNDPDDIFLLQLCLRLWAVRFEDGES